MSKSVYVKIFLLMLPALMVACKKEADTPVPAPEFHTVYYKAYVQTGADTRATLGDDMKYEFEEGDRVYMESVDTDGNPDGNLFGFLTMLVDGDMGNVAVFDGLLNCADNFTPKNTTPVKVTLVSQNDSHVIVDGKVTGVSYPEDKWGATLKEAVSQLSHFTVSGQFGQTSFTLTQQSSFLKCSVSMDPVVDARVNDEITAQLFNNNTEPLRTAVITVKEAGSVPFVFAFPGDEVLNNAKLVLNWTNAEAEDKSKEFPIKSTQTLEANNYYSVSRSMLPFNGFRIIAKDGGTKMTFKYTDGSVQFSEDGGESWYTYDGREFTMNADDEICFQGNRADCDCNGTTQLFKTKNNKVCYIAGDITSLLSDRTQLAPNAFRSAFSNGDSQNFNPAKVEFVDINPARPLKLPAFTSNNCYREMFRNCTSLTSVPDLPATEVAPNCYFNMFRSCTGLTHADIVLPATEMKENCYREIFRQCSQLESVPIFGAPTLAKSCYQQMLSECTSLTEVVCLAIDITTETDCIKDWMYNIKTTGVLKVSSDPDMTDKDWKIPTSWTVQKYE